MNVSKNGNMRRRLIFVFPKAFVWQTYFFHYIFFQRQLKYFIHISWLQFKCPKHTLSIPNNKNDAILERQDIVWHILYSNRIQKRVINFGSESQRACNPPQLFITVVNAIYIYISIDCMYPYILPQLMWICGIFVTFVGFTNNYCTFHSNKKNIYIIMVWCCLSYCARDLICHRFKCVSVSFFFSVFFISSFEFSTLAHTPYSVSFF